ncbi:NAD(P)/FAD-dependent oxidoreductase [Niabella hibiscisoli]|uniref:NAD(P)/FAD-dependent oxidoreductase n=1 Tax=Niabella hibiscisoli TaxID=1825928 RepID=UPI001F118C47|nr:NAD(P)/FAD-dependent oxidoreductase [Niabella hibiscisoli]MCH5721345.1 NAD(P)/FAD-dependent oxidoreductase [Niabella hibiscisoli]
MGSPCNRQTPKSHNFLTRDGEPPHAIAAIAKEQVLRYPTVRFIEDTATTAKQLEAGFEIATQTGQSFTANKLVIASGIKDIYPDIKGFSECWGISVIHCPYCHGYEFRDKKTAIMASGERATHLAMLVSNLTSEISLLANGAAVFEAEQLQKFGQHYITVIESKIVEIEHTNGYLHQLILEDGSTQAFDAVYAALPFIQHSDIPTQLGCELTEQGHIKTDGFQKTNLPGVFACGDGASPVRSVANAVYSGNMAGVMINAELCKEQF